MTNLMDETKVEIVEGRRVIFWPAQPTENHGMPKKTATVGKKRDRQVGDAMEHVAYVTVQCDSISGFDWDKLKKSGEVTKAVKSGVHTCELVLSTGTRWEAVVIPHVIEQLQEFWNPPAVTERSARIEGAGIL